MKRLLGIVITVVLLFTLVISVPASAADENVALGKPVLTVLNGGVAAAADYWRPEYLTDGVAQDTTNGNALGWAYGTLKELGVATDISAYIDLGAVYSVNSAVVVPMTWSPAATYPGAYEIYVSADFNNWTKVAEAGAEPKEGNATYNFDAIEAQFVRLRATSHNGVWADDLFYYNGFGDLQIFGTKVKDSDKALHIYKNYTGDLVTAPPASSDEALGVPTVWTGFTTGSLEWRFTFNTDISFWAINFPLSWGNYGAPLKFKVTKENDETVVAEKDIVRLGDGGFAIDFGKTIPAGKYVLSVAITDDTLAAEGQYAYYNVIGHATGMLDEEYCLNTNGTEIEEAGAVELFSSDDGRGFIKLSEEAQPATQPDTEPGTEPGTEPATQPETVPQTGDAAVAMFAVIAVLAMGAAVVFVKKRVF